MAACRHFCGQGTCCDPLTSARNQKIQAHLDSRRGQRIVRRVYDHFDFCTGQMARVDQRRGDRETRQLRPAQRHQAHVINRIGRQRHGHTGRPREAFRWQLRCSGPDVDLGKRDGSLNVGVIVPTSLQTQRRTRSLRTCWTGKRYGRTRQNGEG